MHGLYRVLTDRWLSHGMQATPLEPAAAAAAADVKPLQVRVWAIYALYTLHQCQVSKRRHKIPLPICPTQRQSIAAAAAATADATQPFVSPRSHVCFLLLSHFFFFLACMSFVVDLWPSLCESVRVFPQLPVGDPLIVLRRMLSGGMFEFDLEYPTLAAVQQFDAETEDAAIKQEQTDEYSRQEERAAKRR